jgi:tRNA threonylcarbamoyl adenosine modification protein (Sua5/YciO/YrdC/YwlC family)
VSQYFRIHETHPQVRLLRQAADILRDDGVIAYPTDSAYALACRLRNKEGVERLRVIRRLSARHNFTLVCRELAGVAVYARVNNRNFRLIKTYIPGPYTFILPATRETPRGLLHPKRRTIGIRIPDHPVAIGLVEQMGEPIISTTLVLPDQQDPMNDPRAVEDVLGNQIELVIDSGFCGLEPTTVIDLTGDAPVLIRRGKGDWEEVTREAV